MIHTNTNQQIILEQLVRKPVSVNPDQIAQFQKDALTEILKRNRKYSLFTAASLTLLFFARKKGVAVSFAKCYAISTVTAAVITGAAAVQITKTLMLQHNIPAAAPAEAPAAVTKPVPPAVSSRVTPSLTLRHFRYDDLSADFASQLEAGIMSCVYRSAAAEGKTLTGSVFRNNEKTVISVRVTDANAAVVFFTQETVISDTDPATVAALIAAKINSSLK